jgi:hypothetical protein
MMTYYEGSLLITVLTIYGISSHVRHVKCECYNSIELEGLQRIITFRI